MKYHGLMWNITNPPMRNENPHINSFNSAIKFSPDQHSYRHPVELWEPLPAFLVHGVRKPWDACPGHFQAC